LKISTFNSNHIGVSQDRFPAFPEIILFGLVTGTKFAFWDLFRFPAKKVIGSDLLLSELADALKNINR
jgi:hypothetical protein